MTTQATEHQISEKQIKFIKNLLEERKGIEEVEALRASLNQQAMAGELTTKVASDAIAALLKIKALPQPYIPLEAGYYFYDGDVYVAEFNKKTKHMNAKKMVIFGSRGKWIYAKGMQATLAKNAEKLTVQQAAAMGHLHGVCVICGRELTDPQSVERGIGPICYNKIC